MKRQSIILFLICSLGLGTIFSYLVLNSQLAQATPIESSGDLLENIDISKYYSLKELATTNNLEYQYQLLNNSGEVLFEDNTSRTPPDFSLISESVIRIRIGAGTGVYFDKFYDIVNENISEYFYAPYAIFGDYVVSIQYISEEKDTFLIIKDMFIENKTYLYQKIDTANSSFPNASIKDMKFLDNKELWIQYESNQNGEIKETIVSF